MGLISRVFMPMNGVVTNRMLFKLNCGSTRFLGHYLASLAVPRKYIHHSQEYFTSMPLGGSLNEGYYSRRFHTNILTNANVSHGRLHEQPRNQKIRAQSVLLIDSEGEKLGTMPLQDALSKAKEKALHVVQIQPQKGASPSICKLVSSRMLYESERKAKHTTQGSKIKELKITGRIAPQDLQWKSKKIYDFLERGYTVKLSITRKPYQKISVQEKLAIIKEIEETVKDVGILNGQPRELGALALTCNFRPSVHKDKPKS